MAIHGPESQVIVVTGGGGGSGDVVGPASAVDSNLAAFDTTTGKLIKDAGVPVSSLVPTSYLDTDGTLAANSDAKLATQKATKTAIDAGVTAAAASASAAASDAASAASDASSASSSASAAASSAATAATDAGNAATSASSAASSASAAASSAASASSDAAMAAAAASSAVAANSAISPGTNTKITYDAKGLVTAGAAATTADIADSSDARYVTDAQRTVLSNTSGTNTGDQDLSGLVPKTTTVNGQALSGNVTVSKSDVGLGSVTNDAQIPLSYLDTDGTLAADSDTKVPSQKAINTKIAQVVAAADAWVAKGGIDCSGNPNYPAGEAGWSYRVTVAGKIGGAFGPNVQVNDIITCWADSTASGDHATVGASWGVQQVNIDGAVTNTSSAASGNFAAFDGTSGVVIEDSGYGPSSFAAALGSDDNYVTDAEKTKLSNLSGTNTGDQTTITGNAGTATALQTARNIDGQAFDGTAAITVIAPGTHAASSKATPVDADEIPLVDSAASNVLKKLTWANLKATLKSYFDTLYQPIGTQPTVQKFTSGSGTYTTPAGVRYIKVEMVGGGGGGAGSGTASQGTGGNGGNTTFGTTLLAANGGAGAVSTSGGAGGTASLGTGPVGQATTGETGAALPSVNSGGVYGTAGGWGGSAPYFNGAGAPVYQAAGGAGVTNTGGGGSGGGGSATANSLAGGGGGSGGFVSAIINSPSSTYSYAVGSAGTAGSAGTNGYAGGAGGSGIIIVYEYY